jgi:hypothetical protein
LSEPEQEIKQTAIAEPSSAPVMVCQDAAAGNELLWEWELED